MVKKDVGIFEYRGVVIVVESDDEGPSITFVAKAGGRSLITMGWAGECALKKVIDNAHRKIDEAYEARSEKLALWMNDTTHWLAENGNRDLVVPVMLTVRGVGSVLEEVLKMATGLSPQMVAKAQQTIDRIKRET
jgi:hypothetical protein